MRPIVGINVTTVSPKSWNVVNRNSILSNPIFALPKILLTFLTSTNSFDKTLNYFKKYTCCVLVFIKDSNLRSVTQTLKDYKNKEFYKRGNDKLIRNYGIGAQIIKDLKIKNMILITKSPKKVIGLEGYDIKITKQELI